ncbi:hypothetical protein MRB53_001061 [Persea americana]|uniref:Uncharacterized protein n=1 Tax=Persea americana TaxID=3435 RepID=A0ACC2MQY4_PERAE|nr:hypothetical protein MRB53_001061 [Persea americana]
MSNVVGHGQVRQHVSRNHFGDTLQQITNLVRSPLSPSALWEEGEEKGDQSEGEGEWVSGFGSWVILDFRNGRSDNLLKERQKKKHFSCFCCSISPFWVDLFCGFFSAFEIRGGLFCNSHKKVKGE